jgi:hypothetical protein
MEMWFGMDDDDVSYRRRRVLRSSRLDMSFLQEELSSRRFEHFRALMKVRDKHILQCYTEMLRNWEVHYYYYYVH